MNFHRLRRVVASAMLLGLLILTAGFPSVPKFVYSQNPVRAQLIESDNPLVLRQGDWQVQSALAASGGAYLFNRVPVTANLDATPALTLDFTGSTVEILYASGPALGILTVEVDDTVLRTVFTTAPTTQFQQRVVINYLSDEPHTLRVYPAQGTIAVDAFIAQGSSAVANAAGDTIAASPTCPLPNSPQLLGYTTSGTLANVNGNVSFSADGHYVAFSASDLGLVPNDTNGFGDVFVRDMQTCTTEIISVSSAGDPSNYDSWEPVISPDGRYVAFLSGANNLVPGDPSPEGAGWEIFVRDRQTNTTTILSNGVNGEWGNFYSIGQSMSDDGRFVAFVSYSSNLVPGDTNGQGGDVFLRDRQANTLTIISRTPAGDQTNGSINSIYVSGDGNWIAYSSTASDVVAGDTNAVEDVFLYDRLANQTTRISMAYDGTQANGDSYPSGISTDGQSILIQSRASNLVPNDLNNANDAFVYNRLTGQIQRVSVASNGAESNADLWWVAHMSSDGRYVAFHSSATNLATGDPGYLDVFIHDLQTGQTTWASAGIGGVSVNADVHLAGLSPDGQWLALTTSVSLHPDDTNSLDDTYIVPASGFIYVPPPPPPPPVCPPPDAPRLILYTPTGTLATGYVDYVSMSADGRYVGFATNASTLVPNDTNNSGDVFVRDMTTCTTEIISVTPTGDPANFESGNPMLSADGRYVGFESFANNVLPGDPYQPGNSKIFLRDRQTNVTNHISMSTSGDWGNWYSLSHGMSDDGRYVAFLSYANNLVPGDTNECDHLFNGQCGDVFLRDQQANTLTIISRTPTGAQSSGWINEIHVAGNGNWVVYSSNAPDLVAGDTNEVYDIFLYNRLTNQTTRISMAYDGTQANGPSDPKGISADGRYILLSSGATNLVPDDTNGVNDLFVYDRQTGQMRRVTVASNGDQANAESGWRTFISDDGRYVAFESSASNLALGDTGHTDVFIHDLQTGHTMWASSGLGGDVNLLGFSRDGQWIVLRTTARLHADDTNSDVDAYMLPLTNFPYEPPPPPPPPPSPDTLVVFNSTSNMMSRVNSDQATPPPTAYITYATGRTNTGQWVMGDWDGDGHDSPAQFTAGAMFYTNDLTTTTNWTGIWLGPNGYPVAGRFDATVNHDCLGVVDSFEFPPYGTGFALYYACDLTSGEQPPLGVQWLSILLPTAQGFSGTHQFSAGDFDGDGVDSIAVRRGRNIAWTDVPPTIVESAFNRAQYFRPVLNDTPEGYFVAGDWDLDGVDNFGLYYSDGTFYSKRNLGWNEGTYNVQSVGLPVGTPATAASWR